MAQSNSTVPKKLSRYHRLDDIPTDTFTPRTYQIQLLDSSLKKNSILCLGCSESKFFLALMLTKELSSITRLPLNAGGKRTFYLTDTEDDIEIICQTLPHHTDLLVSSCPFSLVSQTSNEETSLNGWRSLMESNNILVSYGATFLSALEKNHMKLNEVNLIIFDNCHRAVEVENHPYTEIVKGIKGLASKLDQPHILGVTCAIAGTDCDDPIKLQETISLMEDTMFAYAETSMLIPSERFGCRPKESIIRCGCTELCDTQTSLKEQLEEILEQCYFFLSDCCIAIDDQVDNRDPCETPLQVLSQCLNILNILGSWSASSVSEYFIMQLEKIIKFEKNDVHKKFIRCVLTTLRFFVKIFETNFHPNYNVNELLEYTSPKVKELITVLRQYKPEMDFIIVSNNDSSNDEEEFSDLSDDDDSIMSGSDDDDSGGESSRPLHIAVKRTMDGGHERIMTVSDEEEKSLCGIVFVENRYIAFGLHKIIEEVCSWDENLCFVKSCHISGQGLRGTLGKQKINNKSYKRQEEALRKFRSQECNLVIATLQLEEGIDIPKCNLVVRFDPPQDFRAYTLSKGRARARDAFYVILLDQDHFEKFNSSLKVFKGIEQVLLGENRGYPSCALVDDTDDETEENQDDMQLTPYYTMPNNPSSPHVTMQGAIALINRYCAKLPSDAFTHLTPHCRIETLGDPPLYVAYLRLPINSPIKEELQGPVMKTKNLAKMAVALKMCELLHKKGELDENLVPVGKEMFLYEEEEEWLNEEDISGQARPGTTKRKQYYIKKTADVLMHCQPIPGEPAFMYVVNLKLTGPITDEQNTRGRVIYAPEDTVQTLGLLTSKKIPLIPYFPVFTRSGEVTVSIDLIHNNVICSHEENAKLAEFHHFVFSGVLHLDKDPMEFDYRNADSGFIIVPLNGQSHDSLEIDWDFVTKVNNYNIMEKPAGFSFKSGQEPFKFNVKDFEDAVVMPSYRNIDQPQHFYVAEIRYDLNPLSPFPSPELYKTFQDYYTTKYGLQITNTEQPLLDVDHTSARLNLLTPRYMNQKGVALPTSSAETKRARRENLQQKQILVPELCDVHIFPASLWRKTVCIPAILYRANYLLLSEELRHKICRETGIGLEEFPEEFRFPKLDFGFETCPKKLLCNESVSQSTSPNSKNNGSRGGEVHVGNSDLKTKIQSWNGIKQQKVSKKLLQSNNDIKVESSSDSDSGVASSSSSDKTFIKSKHCETSNISSKEHSPNDDAWTNDKIFNSEQSNLDSPKDDVTSTNTFVQHLDNDGSQINASVINNYPSVAQVSHTPVICTHEPVSQVIYNTEPVITATHSPKSITQENHKSAHISPITPLAVINSCNKDQINDVSSTVNIDSKFSNPLVDNSSAYNHAGANATLITPSSISTTCFPSVSSNMSFVKSVNDAMESSGCEPYNAADLALHPHDNMTTPKCSAHQYQLYAQISDHQLHTSSDSHVGVNGVDVQMPNDSPSIIMNTLCQELSGLDIDLIIPHTSQTFQSFDSSTPASTWPESWLNEMFEDKNSNNHQYKFKEKSFENVEMENKNALKDNKIADSDVIKFSFDTNEFEKDKESNDSSLGTEFSKNKADTSCDTVESHQNSEKISNSITDFKIDFWNVQDKKNDKLKKTSLDQIYDVLNEEDIVEQHRVMPAYKKYIDIVQSETSDEITVSLDEDRDLASFVGPSPCLIMQALTMSNANDFYSLERLETIGDSFLKYAITVYLYCSYPGIHEGKLSYLRSKQVSNYNLYRLGRRKGLAECMVSTKFEPYENWLPPGYVINDEKRRGPIPKVIIVKPVSKAASSLRSIFLDESDSAKRDEAVQFNKELEWIQRSQEADQQDEVQQEPSHNLTPYSLQCHHGLPDKSVADAVEALIGCYLTSCGKKAALIFMSWLGLRVLPKKKKEKSSKLDTSSSFCKLSEYEFDELPCPPSPMFSNTEENQAKLQHLLQGFDSLEEKICYKFRDKSYLLQAFTHASYHYNTITDCYQRVEFLGDAILDYVITRHLYEDSEKYSPGILTDLRSALVNNNIFAALAVKWGFHKYFKSISPSLFQVIDKFVKRQKEKKEDDIDIDEEFRELSLEDCEPDEGGEDDEEEEEVEMEIPKALGDIFESVAGAIYLDSGMSLDTVWRVYYRMMKPHIEKYLKSIPKSPVRELLETEPETAKFERPERTINGKVRVTVNVVGKGVFSGIGRNYRIAKSAAAKKALRSIRTMAQNLLG